MKEKSYKLIERIIEQSNSSNWHNAKLEWKIVDIYKLEKDEDNKTCLCWHYPIRNICILKNKENGNKVVVWQVCAKKFNNLDENININSFFSSILRVRENLYKSVHKKVIEYYYEKWILTEKDKDFYLNIIKKKKNSLSNKQLKRKKNINWRIIKEFIR